MTRFFRLTTTFSSSLDELFASSLSLSCLTTFFAGALAFFGPGPTRPPIRTSHTLPTAPPIFAPATLASSTHFPRPTTLSPAFCAFALVASSGKEGEERTTRRMW